MGTSSTDSILNSYRTGERRLSQSNDSYSSALASSSTALRSSSLLSRTAASASSAVGSDYLRPTRYDSYYSRNSKDTLANGRTDSATNRYVSPSISNAGSGRYLTNASSRDSSFSSSWPSPVRKDILSLTSDTTSGYYRGSPSRRDVPNYSSTPSIAGSTAGIYRPYDSDKTASRCGTPSSRRNSLSYSNYLDSNNVASRLSTDYDRTRRYSGTGAGLGLTDASGHLGLSSRMTTALNGYSSRGAESSASGRLSRSGSRTSFSPMPQTTSVPSPSPLKTSWSKHYSSISSQWAENTGSKINAKSQYNYRPTVSTKFEINANSISSGVSKRNVGSVGVGRKSPKIRKKDIESDGYDSSSSNNDDVSRSTDVTQRSTGSRTKRKSHRKTKSSNANNSLTVADGGTKAHNIKVQVSHDDAKKSSSDEEPSSFYGNTVSLGKVH